MKTEEREFEVQVPKIDGSGTAEKVTVSVPVRWDEELQDWLMTPEGQQIIDDTKARLIDLLLPAQFKELRERYDYSQKEMGELFQVGEKSWTRWESGKHRPSRSINLLIRALYEGEISINYLLKRAGKPQRDLLEVYPEHSNSVGEWLPTILAKHPALVFSPVSGKTVMVHCKWGSGTQVFTHQLVKFVTEHPGAVEGFSTSEDFSGTGRFTKCAPSHSYPQPRMAIPTEA